MDIRLKKETIELCGEKFEICCNFNVLADLEFHLGGLDQVLNLPPMAASRIILAAMLTEASDIKGEAKIYTPREVGRMMPTDREESLKICNICHELLKGAILITEVPAENGESDLKN